MTEQLKAILAMLVATENQVSSFDAQLAAMRTGLETAISASEVVAQPTDGSAPAEPTPMPVSDKVYSQAEMDAAIEAAVLPLQGQIASIQQQLSDVQTGISGAVAEATSKAVAEVVADFESAQVDDNAFLAKWKPQPVAETPTEPQIA
jgi:hypothetical protein